MAVAVSSGRKGIDMKSFSSSCSEDSMDHKLTIKDRSFDVVRTGETAAELRSWETLISDARDMMSPCRSSTCLATSVCNPATILVAISCT